MVGLRLIYCWFKVHQGLFTVYLGLVQGLFTGGLGFV